MRAVHINPLTQQVREVQLDDTNPIRSVVELLGGGPNTHVHLRAIVFNQHNGDTLYTDAGASDPEQLWAYLGMPHVGQGVIVGRNFEDDAEVPLERATSRASFPVLTVELTSLN